MFHFTRLFGACLALFIIIGSSQTSFATAPKIDENGRLILPNHVQLSKLPTNSEQFFKNNNAYEYRATLYIQDIGEADRTEGYTLYKQRADNEIKSVLGHTPRWGEWADSIKEQINADGAIEIAGQLTTNGIQTKGDYLGYAGFRTISNNSRDSTKNHAFTAILPEINARNYFIDQMDNLNLSPQDRAWLHQAYLDRREQAQPNEYRAPYGYDFENQDKSQQKPRNDRSSERPRPTDFGDLDNNSVNGRYTNAVWQDTLANQQSTTQYPKPIDDLMNLRLNGEGEIGYTAGLGVIGQMSSGYARDTTKNVCKTETVCVGIGPMAEVSVGASVHGNTGTLTENSSSWSVTVTGGLPTIGYGGGLSGSVGIDGSTSVGGGVKTGFGVGASILACKKEIKECQKLQ